MKIDPMSAWNGHEDVLKELEKKAKAIGLRVVLKEYTAHLDAMLYDGKKLVAWVHYDPEEDGWSSESHSRGYFPLDEVLDYLADGNRQLALLVSYTNGMMPKLSEETLQAIKKLLPGKPESVVVLPHEFS